MKQKLKESPCQTDMKLRDFMTVRGKKRDVRWQNEYTSLGKDGSERNKRGEVRVNLKLKSIRITIIAVEGQYVLHILSVCLEPCFSSRENVCVILYCHVWSVWLYYIFPHYLKNGTIFGKKYRTLSVNFDFLYNCV